MDIGVISVRYARALLRSSTNAKAEDQVYQNMQVALNSFIEVDKLKVTIGNPMISKSDKIKLLQLACGEKRAPLTDKLIELVLQKRRENLFSFIASSYISQYKKQKNIITGKLTTASSVSANTQMKVRKILETCTKNEVEFETQVDPSLLGGFVLEYDTYSINASVRRKLDTILTELKK